MGGTCIIMRQTTSEYKMSVGTPEGNNSVSRSQDNIKVNLKKRVCDGLDWIHLASDWLLLCRW
jgi:hypothetical protein